MNLFAREIDNPSSVQNDSHNRDNLGWSTLFLNFKNNLFHEHYFNLLIWSEANNFTPHFGMMAWQIF